MLQLEVISESTASKLASIVLKNILMATRNPYSMFAGGGDIDYICGACKVVLAESVSERTLVNIALKCPACGSFNVVRGNE